MTKTLSLSKPACPTYACVVGPEKSIKARQHREKRLFHGIVPASFLPRAGQHIQTNLIPTHSQDNPEKLLMLLTQFLWEVPRLRFISPWSASLDGGIFRFGHTKFCPAVGYPSISDKIRSARHVSLRTSQVQTQLECEVASACADCPGFLVLGASPAPASTLVSEPQIVPLGWHFCFTGPWSLDIAWICCPQLPHHPCKNGPHSTSFYSTGGGTR